MPFLFNNWDHVNKALTSPIGDDLKKSLEPKQLKAFAFSTAGFRHVSELQAARSTRRKT